MREAMNDSTHDRATITQVFTTQQEENARAFAALPSLAPAFVEAVADLETRIKRGGKLIFCGNGGSASSASHMVNDCVGHMYSDREPIPAISISDNASVLTALANDYGFSHIFERQVAAVVGPEDALIAISTSGNSENIIMAVETARERGALIVGLTSRNGGKLRGMSDHWLPADTDDLVCAEHVHLYLLHTLTEALEAVLHPSTPGWGKTVGVKQR